MVAMSTAMGAFAGLFVATYANVVRKLPAFRQPWQHVGLIGAGAYGFNQLEAFEERVRCAPLPLNTTSASTHTSPDVPTALAGARYSRCRRVFSLPSTDAAVPKPARRGEECSFIRAPRTSPYLPYAVLV
jgi:hypothetical protein